MPSTEIVIVGAGGFALEVEDYIADCVRAGSGLRDPAGAAIAGATGARVVGVLDPGAGRLADFVASLVHFADEDAYDPGGRLHVIAVGDPAIRAKIASRLTAKGARFVSVVHPSAKIAATATIGSGCIVGPFAFVGPRARLGAHAVLNTYSSVGHDSVLGDCTVLSPYACTNGHAVLGALGFMGSGAVITPGKLVGARSRLAAGAVVYCDFGEGFLIQGNPAKGRQLFP
jgi:sugar O-acyltransferase (sialic acid O-acetyltransferase NeuD family)